MREIKNTRKVVTVVEVPEGPSTYCFEIDLDNGLNIQDGKIIYVYEGDWRAGGSYRPEDSSFERACKSMIRKIASHSSSDLHEMYNMLSPGKMKDLCKLLIDVENF